ncbi:esterase/lipase family protein [Pantoea sp.]|uniref:esterase/lipase family protein n=1 Tax=Pantoea sp. TaxID=69393 RepID=UPI0039779D4D
MKVIARFFSVGLLALSTAQFAHAGDIHSVVLVHGAFADGSSWDRVIPQLQAKNYEVIAVQLPLTSLQDDVAATQRAMARKIDAHTREVAASHVSMVSHPDDVARIITAAVRAK